MSHIPLDVGQESRHWIGFVRLPILGRQPGKLDSGDAEEA